MLHTGCVPAARIVSNSDGSWDESSVNTSRIKGRGMLIWSREPDLFGNFNFRKREFLCENILQKQHEFRKDAMFVSGSQRAHTTPGFGSPGPWIHPWIYSPPDAELDEQDGGDEESDGCDHGNQDHCGSIPNNQSPEPPTSISSRA